MLKPVMRFVMVALFMAAPLTSPAQPQKYAVNYKPVALVVVYSKDLGVESSERVFLHRLMVEEKAEVARQGTPVLPQAVPASTGSKTGLPASKPRVVASQGVGSNHFYFGQCTYYVATRRYIPWFGDAWVWARNAQAVGYRTGVIPVVGAVMQRANHVAYVEKIFANGTFLVSEMNWYGGFPFGGWGRIDFRTLSTPAGAVFIY